MKALFFTDYGPDKMAKVKALGIEMCIRDRITAMC